MINLLRGRREKEAMRITWQFAPFCFQGLYLINPVNADRQKKSVFQVCPNCANIVEMPK